MTILVSSDGIGTEFCDDFFWNYYGWVEEMKLYCGPPGRNLLEGLTTRYGPVPGSNVFVWSSIHGGNQADSSIVNWILTDKVITDIEIYRDDTKLTGLQMFVAEEGTNIRQELPICGDAIGVRQTIQVNPIGG